MTKKELKLQNELLLDEVKFLRKQTDQLMALLTEYDFNSKQQYSVIINPQPVEIPSIDLTPKITWFN